MRGPYRLSFAALHMSAVGGGLNGSTQHSILKGKMECSAMRRGYFRGFTASEKTELWDRWQRGESLKAIGRAFGKPSSSIYFQLAPYGGIRPPPRRRSRLNLAAQRSPAYCLGHPASLCCKSSRYARLQRALPSNDVDGSGVERPWTIAAIRRTVTLSPAAMHNSPGAGD